jgi:DNA-binding protein YbaB
MKRLLLLSVTLLIISCSTVDAQKVKGNRDVTIERTDVDPFTHLLVNDDFEVEVIQSNSTHVDIETDSNLHEHLYVSTKSGTLELSKTANIRRSKRMKVTVYANQLLDKITVNGDGELRSAGTLVAETLEVNAGDSGSLNISVDVKNLNVHANKSTKLEISGKGDEVMLHLSQNAYLKGDLNFDTGTITMDHRSDAEVSGTFNNGIVDVKENSHLRSKGLTWDNMTITARHESRAEINVKDDLIINAVDDAEISIYNSPKIKIERFTGEAILRKEE